MKIISKQICERKYIFSTNPDFQPYTLETQAASVQFTIKQFRYFIFVSKENYSQYQIFADEICMCKRKLIRSSHMKKNEHTFISSSDNLSKLLKLIWSPLKSYITGRLLHFRNKYELPLFFNVEFRENSYFKVLLEAFFSKTKHKC